MRYAEVEGLNDLIQRIKNQTGAYIEAEFFDEGEIFLSYVERGPEDGSGYRAIALLLDYADEHSRKVVLTVLHNSPRLVRYYEKLGFKVSGFATDADFEEWFADFEKRWTIDNEEEDIIMVREPR